MNAIPIEIIGDEPGEAPKPEKPANEPEPEPQDVEESAASDEGPAPVEAPPSPSEPAPQPTPAQEPTPADQRSIGDPVAMSGAAGDLVDSNANVRLLLHNDVVRSHPLGPKVGELLSRTPQWRDFFGPAGVDPVSDVDRVLIAGPQLRDSSNIVAVVQHRLGQQQVDQALETLVARNGRWLDRDARLLIAKADRAERVFYAPSPNIVAVAPPSALESVKRLGDHAIFPSREPDAALQAYLVTPWRAFRGMGIRISKKIEWVRIEIRPQSSGGVTIRLLAQDASPEEAEKNAQFFEQLIKSFTRSKSGGGLFDMLRNQFKPELDQISFQADGDKIIGNLAANPRQLREMLDMLDVFLPPPAPRLEEAGATTRSRPDSPPDSPPDDGSTELEVESDTSSTSRSRDGAPRDDGPSGGSSADGPAQLTPEGESGESDAPETGGTAERPSSPAEPEQ